MEFHSNTYYHIRFKNVLNRNLHGGLWKNIIYWKCLFFINRPAILILQTWVILNVFFFFFWLSSFCPIQRRPNSLEEIQDSGFLKRVCRQFWQMALFLEHCSMALAWTFKHLCSLLLRWTRLDFFYTCHLKLGLGSGWVNWYFLI